MSSIEAIKNAQRLKHIVEAICRIDRSLAGVCREQFFADEDKQGNVVRCFEIIGEAANHVSEEIRQANADIPWAAIIGMRNNLIHGYNEVDYEIVWEAVQVNLKGLKDRISSILSRIDLPEDFTCTRSTQP